MVIYKHLATRQMTAVFSSPGRILKIYVLSIDLIDLYRGEENVGCRFIAAKH